MSNATINLTSTPINLVKSNLNSNCPSSCWADDGFIDSVTVSNISFTITSVCAVVYEKDSPTAEEGKLNGPDYIITSIGTGGVTSLTDLAFSFLKPPKEVYFEITDPTGDFVYERFFDNIDKLNAGFDFASMNLEKGEYIWEIEAVYDGEEGIERKIGEFKIE